MICPNCKKNNKPDSLFCEYCGSQLKKQKKSKKGLWITLSVIFVVIAVVIAVCTIRDIREQRQKQEHLITWRQQQAKKKQQELEQELRAERKAREEAARKAEAERKTREEAERKAELARLGFVDLGLPSGTLWKNSNEGGDSTRYTYDEAVRKFGNKLPTKQQLEELKNKCTWTWTGSGYKVTGPNGESITLPAAGYRLCDGDVNNVNNVGAIGYYWSSTPSDSDYAWYLGFSLSEGGMSIGNRCYGLSVRLVQ